MFNTPPHDRIRSIKCHEQLNERLQSASCHVLAKANTVPGPGMDPKYLCSDKVNTVDSGLNQQDVDRKVDVIKKKSESVVSSFKTTSSHVRRKQLELAAAEAKAAVVQKQLELELAKSEHEKRTNKTGSSSSSQSEMGGKQELMRPVTPAAEAVRAPYDDSVRTPALHPPVDSILQLAHTLKGMMTNSSSQHEERLLTRLSTPRELPIFSGDCIEWLHFKSAYEESTNVCQFSDSENLWRLRRALKGEAKEAVTDLLIGNTSPAAVMEALELRFGNSDLIMHHLTSQMKKLSPLSTHYQNDIIAFSMKINNCVATLYSLNQHDYLRSPELAATITSKLPSILISKWTDYAYTKLASNIPKLQLLAAFLKREAEMVSVVGVTNLRDFKKVEPATSSSRKFDEKPRSSNYNRPILTTALESSTSKLCIYCKKSSHLLTECRLFKRAMTKNRWRFVKSKGLCFCCLVNRHERNACPAPMCDIDSCGLAHHRLLHYNKKPDSAHTQPPNELKSDEPAHSAEDDESSHRETVAHLSAPQAPTGAGASPHQGAQGGSGTHDPLPARAQLPESVVLLKVVKVLISGPKRTISTYALLDDGASISMIDKNLVQELGISVSKSSPIKFIDTFGVEIFQSDAPKICTKISGFYDKQSYDVTLRQVDKFKLPKQNLSVLNNLSCKHLLHIKDVVCKQCVVPRLLIGEDNYHLLAPLELLHGDKREPYATRCRLGWSIHGCYGLTHSSVNGHTFHLSHSKVQQAAQYTDGDIDTVNELNDLVKKSFELDSIGVSTLRRENTEHLRAVRILDETARHLGNQWEVGLPFVKDEFTMPDTYDYARSRLQGILRKFKADQSYAERYKKEMSKLFEHGYARELEKNELSASPVWYLSHFGVQNPNKPGKLRLVFDCAGKVKGVCLNDYLLTGPDLYNSLLGIMLRFRENQYAIIGDIKDFFVQIKIRPEDQHVFRFLWQESSEAPIKICIMQSLLFGATCSPFIAQYIRNKNALKYQDLHPEAVDVIINNHYVDDCLHSCATEAQAIELVRDITSIHKSGGFEITRWSSNNKQVLQYIPSDALAPTATEFKHGATNTTERTLGLMWHPCDDSFGFKIALDRIPQNILNGSEPPTKAQMLSIIMSVYDLHGFLSPFIIKGKIIFQNVHRSGVEWNCRIQPEEHALFVSWLNDLQSLRSLRIPRWYQNAHEWSDCYSGAQWTSTDDVESHIIDKEMHIFCDASTKAYAAVIYWRLISSNGRVLVCFVASKSRVSPLRPVSVPRLELQGALLAARLAATMQHEHKDVQPTKRYFWTDSSTVLQWIRSDPRDYKPYVAHRLGEIDELTKSNEWRHVPTGLNVADVATREDAPPLAYSSDWFQGPSFLRRSEEQWPKDLKRVKPLEETMCEMRTVNIVTESYNSGLSLPNEDNISSWITLVRATARVLLFIRRCQRKVCQLDTLLMKEAEDLLIKKCQLDSYNTEISCLKNNRELSSNSRLLQVSPYLDDLGILRVSGRIDKIVGVEYGTRRPAILDGRHRITRLLVEHYHKQALHGANELVVNNLRQQYWIVNLRPTVRTVASQCLFCRYRRATPQPQRMADLPAARLQHNRRPFSHSGVDFFGPLAVTIGRRRYKRYGMIFTCLTVRAIHIEVTEDLTADSTIMALRRMGARRGMPQVIISDNGTNLRGADAELKRSIGELDTEAVREAGAVRGVEWRFIPPGAPEMGGSWERMIRTVKSSLKVILKERAPHPDTLLTLVAEVEALVNSRPITHVSNDPNYPEALTPNHFLIGASSNSPQFGKYDDSDLCLRRRWRIAQRLADMFWARWLKEFLPTLLPRQKWTREARPLQVGDYVILVEPNVERSCWRHGVVSATHPGRDGRVRMVDVRTRTGVLRRPVTRIALLSPQDGSAN